MNGADNILIATADNEILSVAEIVIAELGFKINKANTVKSCLEYFENKTPVMVLCDILFSDGEGTEVVRDITKVSKIPVIGVSECNDPFVKTLYLEMGCDDFITYPFDRNEFKARIRAVMRRYLNKTSYDNELIFNGLIINISRYELTVMGKKVNIPPKELELLHYLAGKPNVVFTRDQLLDKVWGFDYIGDTRTVDVHIKRLREKLKGHENMWEIETVWGIGYKFSLK